MACRYGRLSLGGVAHNDEPLPRVHIWAVHGGVPAAYTFDPDSADDRRTLANLARTGDVVSAVYGVMISIDHSSTVRVGVNQLSIEDTKRDGH